MANSSSSSARLNGRYEIQEQIGERPGLTRFRGIDHSTGQPVIILRGGLPEMMAEAVLLEEDAPVAAVEASEDDFMPSFDEPMPVAKIESGGSVWPSVGWELALLEKAKHPAVPGIIESFADGTYEYLVADCPQGRILWDAWDDPDIDAGVRYGWLVQVAQGLQALHQAGAIIEGIRPDLITITDAGQAIISDLSDLLPLPIPAGTPLRANLYTAPELILSPDHADARADLYSFGAMIYSLEYLHHALEEKDFERQFSPRLITDRFPDVHPGFFRLVCKTFTRDLNTRFPTDEAGKKDPTGFTELIDTLEVCRRSFDNCRLDIAAWTTTGMVRTGNEDAFGLMHAVESRQDDLSEYAVVLLCDGMGGYEAGEVAAQMCVAALRTYVLQQPMFAALAGKEPPEPGVFDVAKCRETLKDALKYANKEVYTAARTPGKGRRGMGCTAEAVYVDSRNVVVGHVGDSRTYHLTHGRLKQLTRDQTLVNRLVELGQLTAEEAEDHPRKNELQQAIGGQPDVQPGLYSGKLTRGDWVLVCSDGLTNHVPTADLEKMLTRETANSAEEAARRLLNLVNLRGATDNATIVVIRVM
jgi:protein phosphatase